MNEMLATIWERQSIRKYKNEPIPDEDLNLILEVDRRGRKLRREWFAIDQFGQSLDAVLDDESP